MPCDVCVFPSQVAGVRTPLLPGFATGARGGGVQQPRRLGSGSALRGITSSAQNRKYCRLYRLSTLFFKGKCSLFAVTPVSIFPQGEPRVENTSEPKVRNIPGMTRIWNI